MAGHERVPGGCTSGHEPYHTVRLPTLHVASLLLTAGYASERRPGQSCVTWAESPSAAIQQIAHNNVFGWFLQRQAILGIGLQLAMITPIGLASATPLSETQRDGFR